MSKYIVKSLVTELGGQYVVLKREKQGPAGQRGIQSTYTVLDSDTLKTVGQFTDKKCLRDFIEDLEWGQKTKERAERKASLAETLAAGEVGTTTVTTTDLADHDQLDHDDDDLDDLDEESEIPADHGIQQPPV